MSGGLEGGCQGIWSHPSGLDNGLQVAIYMNHSGSNHVAIRGLPGGLDVQVLMQDWKVEVSRLV